MIAYVTVSVDDIARAKRFFAAFLSALGYELEESPECLSYLMPVELGQSPILPDFFVKPNFNGRPASTSNVAMVVFEARNQKQVRDLHAFALFADDSDEGKPSYRATYGPHFYVCYLRDSQGYNSHFFSCGSNKPERDR
ncbi:MAG: VOC family protein [Roseibium sp.]